MMHFCYTERTRWVLENGEIEGITVDETDIHKDYKNGTILVYAGQNENGEGRRVFVLYNNKGGDPLVWLFNGASIDDCCWDFNDDGTLSPLNEEETITFQQLLERY